MDSSGLQNTTTGWVATGDQNPIGPLSSVALEARIRSGEVPVSALVCEVGGNAWKALSDVAGFRIVLGDLARNADHGSADLHRVSHLGAFDDPHEQTIVERPAFDSTQLAGAEDEPESDDLPTIRPTAPRNDGE